VKIASERSMNWIISPLKKYGNIIQLPFEFKKYHPFKSIKPYLIMYGFWDIDCFNMMDVISNEFLNQYFSKKNGGYIPKNPYEALHINEQLNLNKDDLFNINNDILNKKKKITRIKISDFEIKKYSFFNHLSSNKIFDIMNKIMNCKFQLVYGVRNFLFLQNKKIKTNYINFNNLPESRYKNPDQFCLIKINKEHQKANKQIYEREYLIEFKTPLSFLFIRNLILINIDWIPEEVYLIKYKPAQYLYRFFFTHNNKKKIKLNLNDIKFRLNLKNSNINQIRNLVLKSIEELKNIGIVKKFDFINDKNIHVENV